MKKIISSLALIMSFYNSFAQYDYYTTIKTPTNVSIEAIYRVECSPNDLAQFEEDAANWLRDHDSQAVRVAPASRTYNCHNFAWHSSDGGETYWVDLLDQYGGTNLSKYWTGSSPTYQQTTSWKATKVFYPNLNDEHSTKVISSTGLFESKWGNWPRYQHSPSDCPYTSSNLQYYYVPVSGDDLVCSSKTFSTLSITGAHYDWNGSGVSTSDTVSSITATKTTDGSGWIQAQVSSPYSGTTFSTEKKPLWMGAPSIEYIQGPTTVQPNVYYTYYAQPNNNNNSTSYHWYVYPSNDSYTSSVNWKEISFSNTGSNTLIVTAQNACG